MQVAREQYLEGATCAAKLTEKGWLLNASFLARGPVLHVACLNNAAIVRSAQRRSALSKRKRRLPATSPALARACGWQQRFCHRR